MNLLTRGRALLLAMAMVGPSLLAGCGGGSAADGRGIATTPTPASGSCSDSAGCGPLYIGITDADGDFLSYTVDVVSLSLRRANGTVVETLPNQTRVDFAQYVDLTELITAATVPNGTYAEGTLRLDYTNASVTVERNGQPVAATVVGANGAPLGVVDVRIVLDNRNHLVVAPGRPALLTLDFNLAATNTVDLSVTPVRVTARPTLIASLEPIVEKEMRLRGPLVSVDTAASTYTIDVRPFHHPHARHGRVTVRTTGTTAFEVNGQSFTGSAGLQALAAAGLGTPTVAFGTLSTTDRAFTAERVHAGSSVPGHNFDTVIGTIIARNGNQLLVRGGTIVRELDPAMAINARDDHASFERGDIRVMIGPNTVVTKDGMGTQQLGVQALSVGQLIHAHGRVLRNSVDATLDATQGRVRMHLTRIFGTVVNHSPGLTTLNLLAINGRPVNGFNFAGTGASPAQDADPSNYEVRTPPVTIMQILTGTPLSVLGFVTPFGSAPPDFESRTLVNFAELRAQLGIDWGTSGTTAPFSSMNSAGLVLNLTNPTIGARHHIHVGPMVIDLKALGSSPLIVGATSGRMMFAIAAPTGVQHYSVFADFVAALTTSLNGSTRMVTFTAAGSYDRSTNTFTATEAAAVLR